MQSYFGNIEFLFTNDKKLTKLKNYFLALMRLKETWVMPI